MAIANIVTAFGLAGAAGLNAYIPLLLVGIAGRLGYIHLASPFDVLTTLPALIVLGVMLVIETVVDKIPVADHVNDVVQTFIRPAAGAVLFAANSGVIKELDPTVSLVIGLVMALGVHGVKAAARPAVNLTTMGVGAPIISFIEDVISAVAALLALFAPIIFVLFAALVVYMVVRLLRRIRGRAQTQAVMRAS